MKRVITGATGFIGSYLARHLTERFPADGLLELGSDDVDLTDAGQTKAVIEKFSPDEIYHLAGRAQVADNWGVAGYFPRNFLTTLSVVKAATGLAKPVKIFFSSSIHVYGNRDEMVSESSTPQPLSAYGFTKFLAEEALRNYSNTNPRLSVVVARLSNCIGPGQPGGFVAADLCLKIASLPANNSLPLEVGPLSSTRTFLDVRDAVKLFPELLNMTDPQKNRFEIFNVASPNEVSIQGILESLLSLSGKSPKLKEDTSTPPNQFSGLSVSNEKLVKKIPHTHFRPLGDSLKDMYAHCLKNLP